MRIGLKNRTRDGIEFGIVYGGIGLLILAAARFPPLVSLAPRCAFKAITGFPCPTCGSTRSLVHLAQADLLSAFALNPMTCAVFLAAVFVFLYSVVALAFGLPRIDLALCKRERAIVRIAVVAAVLSNWLYLFFAL